MFRPVVVLKKPKAVRQRIPSDVETEIPLGIPITSERVRFTLEEPLPEGDDALSTLTDHTSASSIHQYFVPPSPTRSATVPPLRFRDSETSAPLLPPVEASTIACAKNVGFRIPKVAVLRKKSRKIVVQTTIMESESQPLKGVVLAPPFRQKRAKPTPVQPSKSLKSNTLAASAKMPTSPMVCRPAMIHSAFKESNNVSAAPMERPLRCKSSPKPPSLMELQSPYRTPSVGPALLRVPTAHRSGATIFEDLAVTDYEDGCRDRIMTPVAVFPRLRTSPHAVASTESLTFAAFSDAVSQHPTRIPRHSCWIGPQPRASTAAMDDAPPYNQAEVLAAPARDILRVMTPLAMSPAVRQFLQSQQRKVRSTPQHHR